MFAKIVLILGAVMSAYIGVNALGSPGTVLTDFGVVVPGADGRNEIRGQYGGFFIVLAIVMALSVIGKLPERFGLGVFLMTVGGVLLGRIASLILEGPSIFSSYSTNIQALHAVDTILVILTILALRSVKRRR